MCHDAQDNSISEAVHLWGLPSVQSNLPRQFRLSLAQVSSLWTMILIGRMLPLLTPTTNHNTNLGANRPTSSTRSRSKPYRSDNNNTNKQLAEVLGRLANTNSRGTKAHIPDTFSSTESNKLNNFLFQCRLYFRANPAQFDMDIVKINFAIITNKILTGCDTWT